MRPSRLDSLLVKLGELQNRRPLLVVLLVLLTLVPTGLLASRLSLRTAFSELLPDDKRSVIEMRHISERLTSSSTLSVLAQSENVDGLKRFIDVLAPQIRKLDPKLVTTVEDGTREVQDFFRANKHLYADLADIQEIRDDVVDRYDYEVQKQGGMDLGLDDAEGASKAAPLPHSMPTLWRTNSKRRSTRRRRSSRASTATTSASRRGGPTASSWYALHSAVWIREPSCCASRSRS